jgi:asparagine synthase (glutamine-hydrolysing)
MSTILALWNRIGEPVEQSVLQKMLAVDQSLAADGQDSWNLADVGMACRYFWITPEEKGQPQPRVDPESGCVLTCSARLDNRAELMRNLGIPEARAKHTSDADLILSGYKRWGVDSPRFLLGDFSFLIWDPQEHYFFGARDALGAEELYYCLDIHHFIATSRISILLAHPAVKPRLNELKVAEFLALRFDDNVNTFYDSIFHLPPAHCLLVKGDSSRTWRYWDVDPEAQIRYARHEEYSEHYRELITESVRCHIRSAYPVGISLSGGLDSPSLTCLASQIFQELGLPQERLWSFSYVFDRLVSCDERVYIQAVLEQTNHWQPVQPVFILGDELFPAPLEPGWLIERDYPYQDVYSYLLQAILKSGRANGLRVMISGYGGDDLYSGEDFWLSDMLRQGRLLHAAKTLHGARHQINMKDYLLNYGLRPLIPGKLKAWYRELRPRKPAWEAWIHHRLASQTGLLQLDKASHRSPKLRLPGQQARYSAMFQSGFPEGFTAYQDLARRNGMQYTFPFLDRRLVEFVVGLPSEQIALPDSSRRVLREAMSGVLPEAVRQRVDKTLFFEVFELGFYGRSFSDIQKLLTQPQIVEREFIRGGWLEGELAGTQGRTQEGLVLWIALSLENWLRKYW